MVIPSLIKTAMALLINCNSDSVWKDRPNNYVAHIPMPGIALPIVHQNGNIISITGESRVLDLSYNYSLTLKPDSTQTINVQAIHGMVIITAGKVSAINRDLPINPPAAGQVPG